MAETKKKKSKDSTKKTRKKSASKKRKNTRRRKNSGLRSLMLFLILSGLAAFFAVALYVAYCYITLPDIEAAVSRTRQPATSVIAENGQEIRSYGSIYSEVIYPKDLPDYVKNAVVATEDRRFYSHFGFDIIAFSRAMAANIAKGRYAQGGSTITQQVAKNLFLTSQKNIKRKVQELLMAFWLENKFSKDQILTLYLNRVYMGNGTYGIEAASQKYFQKSSRDLNMLEGAILAGLLKAPGRYNPVASRKRAIERATVVLQIMTDTGKITPEQRLRALKMPLGAQIYDKLEGGRHFADWVYSEVNAYLGERDSDINVYTTLDKQIQKDAEQILQEAIAQNRKNNVTNGAIVVLDMSGAVRAMVGGVNYDKSQFNRATQALRQPGSSFKTFVYLTALQQGYSPDDIIKDLPLSIGKWRPENYDKKIYGDVSINDAFSRSLNLATVNLAEKLPRKNIIRNAQKMGISTPLKDIPSLALGSSVVKVIDMAVAYTAIANGGYAVWPYSINEIYSRDGYLLYNHINEEPVRILDEKIVRQLKEMMQNVVEKGTGKRAQLPFFAAGKTGTSQDYRDAWFVGFTKHYVAAVWIGNDNNTPMKGIGGGGLPAEIWQKVMLSTEQSNFLKLR